MGGGNALPDIFCGAVIMRQNGADQMRAFIREHDPVGATVVFEGASFDEAAILESIDESGDIGAVHDEEPAEFGLGVAGGQIDEEIEDVKLGDTQIPSGEEEAAGVPEGFGGAEEFEEGVVTRTWMGRIIHWNNVYQ
jgi:hypothetical protein